NGQVALSWSAATGAASYNLYRSTTSGGEGSTPVVTGIASTSYTNTGLTNGITYYFRVAAVNASGTSGQSNQASATPTAPPPAPPSTPTNLTAAPGNGRAEEHTSEVTARAHYIRYRSTTSGGEGSTPVVTGIASTSYTNPSLHDALPIYFRVAAVNASGTSGQSNQASATPTAPPPAPPSTPTNLTAAPGNG